jgi:glycolate oxidase FAD binding subunit
MTSLDAYRVDARGPGLWSSWRHRSGSGVLALAIVKNLRSCPGAGDGNGHGAPAGRLDLVLSLARLNRVLEHEPADMTASVQAGISMAALQARWKPSAMVALDPPLPATATVGGIGVNASGPKRLLYGTARDLLIGITVVHAMAHLESWGKVTKNVTGYDMMKLYIGSLGTLQSSPRRRSSFVLCLKSGTRMVDIRQS